MRLLAAMWDYLCGSGRACAIVRSAAGPMRLVSLMGSMHALQPRIRAGVCGRVNRVRAVSIGVHAAAGVMLLVAHAGCYKVGNRWG